MAKVRVYELAKELNMESKKLVEKLQSSGMNIKNYMSTLDEDAAGRAREIASGVVSEVIEEKRIKPTIIRRRKKIKVKSEAPEVKEKEEPEEKKEEVPEPELSPEEIKEKEAAVVQVEAQKEVKKKAKPKKGVPAKKSEPPAKKEEAEAEEKPKPRKAKKKKVEKPAKIIKPAVKVVPKEPPEKPHKEKPVKPSTRKGAAAKIRPEEPLEIAKKVTEEAKEQKPAKKKKGWKKGADREPEKKGVYRRRKKEVYERADLYEGRGVGRKRKKGGKRAKADTQKGKQTEITVPKAIKRRIKVPEFVTVADLAKAMGIKAAEMIKNLMGLGQMVNINQLIEFETASVVADEFGYELDLDTFEEVELIAETEDRPEDLKARPPVVTIMGHVDHGKTLLLDYIRKSNIIGGEAGGITQHIGAYYVETEGGDIVFLDTPGHEAFTAMRARGAEVTDIIVLVVAADDGVMPQTRESIDHARAADIPILVAINKIDKPDSNAEKVKRDLAAFSVAAEDWGGETLFAQVSAKTGQGIDELLGLILLQAEMLELKANPNKSAKGTVIEAKLDKSKGSVATILVKNGTLRPGEQFICGDHYGRVRAMNNHRGETMKTAGPSMPVEIYGISGVPMAGDKFIVVQNEKTAKQIAEHRKRVTKEKEVGKKGVVSLDALFERIKEGEVKDLNIILKTDVQGSLEALGDLLIKQSTDEVKLKIIHMATGTITESDVMLASASSAIIIGFNVRANPRVTELAKNEKIDIRYYDVIYNAVKDIRAAMTGLLEPVFEEHIIGRAYIKEIFHVPRVGVVSGCQVSDGHVERNANLRLLRDGVVVFDGKIASLRRFKEDVKEVQSGYECGIGLENYNDVKPGDVFEVYQMEEVEAHL
ncbi:MAG: translation initiation factor IF-2 [Deltaproteobacteria bacterium]|nr:translation initiation factor IF-2 [Deltaproteobacteria bacterium]